MASISKIREAVQICRDANVTPFIWGHRGLGKSSLILQLCQTSNWGFIDMRCSQCEASDIRGLPDRGDDGRTHFLPPADMPIGDLTVAEVAKQLGTMPDLNDLEGVRQYNIKWNSLQPRMQHGILFLDELNRSQDDVLQAAFQLVLDRRVGGYTLPPGWAVVAAGNFMEGYMVSGFSDPAFLNRFCHLTLSGGDTTMEEWVSYMSTVHGADAGEVIEYASQNVKHLDGDLKGELGFSTQPSRRSWEMVVRVKQACRDKNYSEEAMTEVIAGLVGRELAISFRRYSCPVKPGQLLEQGVKAHEKALDKLERNQMTGLMWGMVSHCKNRINEEKVATVCLDFASWMVNKGHEKDLVVAFAHAMVGSATGNQQGARAAVITNPKLATMIARFHEKHGKEKTFIDRLTQRPELQKALSKVAWGSE